jgi:glycosyltransferase involved in cell wall biosynthesis
MRIFVIANDSPSRSHTTRAANRVLACLIDEFRANRHEVILQVISSLDSNDGAANSVSIEGIEVLPPFWRRDFMRPGAGKNVFRISTRIYERVLNPVEFFYHATALRSVIDERLRSMSADIVFVFWNSEGLAATYRNHRVPRIAYYGMPDHAASLARLEDADLFDVHRSPVAAAIERRNLAHLEKAQIALMNDCDVVTNLCAEHADYFSANGHPRSLYMPNVWPPASRPSARRANGTGGKLKIFGSMGRLSATGNTYGLHYIGQELLPRLDRAIGPDAYEMHILGSGDPVPAVARVLNHPSLRMRGWVEDIDMEIESSDVFLVANNTGRYRGAHTRFLHAWSLKASCVAHSYNAQAMPEMIHMKNALLGETPDQIVDMILQAYRQPELRQRIGEAGFETFNRCFRPPVVAGRLLAEMESLAAGRRCFA